MRLFYVNDVNNGRVGAAIALLFVVVCPLSVRAEDTQIGAVVCGADAPGASVSITQPVNDSVLDQPVVKLRGDVSNSAQLEIFINDIQDRTVAIGANQSTFQADLTLPEGTNTIVVRANDICGASDDAASITITYAPAAIQPSAGNNTPTTIEGTTTLNGDPVTAKAEEQSGIAQQVRQFPVIGSAIGIISDFAAAVGIQSTVANGNASVATGTARIGITVAALTSVVLAGTLAPFAAQIVPGISEVFSVTSHRSMLYLGWVIRGIGVAVMALAYFL